MLELTNSSTAQCTPQSRVWNGERAQKCESCGMRNLPCGPNFKRDEDPEVLTPRDEYRYASESDNTTGSPYDTTSGYQSLSTSDNLGRMPMIVGNFGEVSNEKDGKGELKAESDENLKLKALAK